jgi:hypothetical protein
MGEKKKKKRSKKVRSREFIIGEIRRVLSRHKFLGCAIDDLERHNFEVQLSDSVAKMLMNGETEIN